MRGDERPQEPLLGISVVSPMYNEESCIEEFHRRVTDALRSLGRSYEIIAVSDGSTDRTNEMLAELARRDPHVRFLTLSRNTGQWAAISAGLTRSRGRCCVVMDADLQHAPEEIPLLVAEMDKGFDLVSGSRVQRRESFLLRRLPSLVANAMLRATTGCPVRDMGGFKCIRGDIARGLHLRAGQHRLLPALVHLIGGSVSEVPVSAPPRFAGKSSYGLGRSVDVLFDILNLWFHSSFKSRPLYLFGRISLVIFALAAVITAWLVTDKLLYGVAITERPAFYVCLAGVMVGFFGLGLGFVLEMLSEALNRIRGQDPFVVIEPLEDARSVGEPLAQGAEAGDREGSVAVARGGKAAR